MAEQQEPKPWEKLRQRAADQSAATFVNQEGGIEVFQRDAIGDAQQKALTARGLKPASPEDIEKRAKFLENSTTEAQTRGAIELGLNTATAGAIGKEDFGQGADERREALEQASPSVAMGARIVGSAIPMALTGGAAGALGGGAAVVGAAEGLGAGLAEENAQSRWEGRELSAGNIALAGLGGAVFGSAIPAVLKRGSRLLAKADDAVAAAAGEVGENLGVQLEAKATARAAGKVDKIPPGPARDTVLVQGAPQHLEKVQTEIGDVVTRAPEALGKSDIDKATLKRLMPKDAPNQTAWATQTAEDLRALAGKAEPVAPVAPAVPPPPASPISLAGKSLEDLKALPLEGEAVNGGLSDVQRVQALKDDPTFASTGRVSGNDGRKGITLVNDDGELVLRDGRHRLGAAKELGRDSVYGRYVDGKTGEVIFEGEIPLKAPANDVAPPSGIRRNAKGARIGELRKGEGSPIDLSEWDVSDFAKGKGSGKAAGKNVHGYSGGENISQYQRSIVDGLKKNEQFASTGRIAGDAGKLGSEPTIHVLPDSTLQLGHGRLRITAARELGMTEVYGKVMLGSGKDAKLVYEGMIPVGKGGKAAAGAGPAIPPAAAGGDGGVLRKVAGDLLESKGGLDTMQRARAALSELRSAGAPQEAIDALRKGIADQSLFGRAAEAMADFDAAHARMPGSPLEGFDPSNLSQASREKLVAMAEALEDRAAARAKWDLGGGKDKASDRLLGDARRIRDNLALADDVAGAKGRAAQSAPAAAPKPKPERPARSFAKEAGQEAVEWIVEQGIGHAIPGAGLLMKGARFLWSNVDASGKAAVDAAARSVARGALGAAERASAGLGKVAPTALETFSEGFPGAHEAFAARSAMLTEMVRDPMVLANAMAESFGDLPRENPKLFQEMAIRMARATQYVTANLPVGIATSLAYPRGVPPSQSSLREFATIWNSAMDPHTVVEAVGNGSATPAQVKTLAAVDPDTYQQLTQSVIKEVGSNYSQMPAQTKQWLDILFQSDGIAGPGFSWKAATYISEGEKTNPRQPMPMGKLPPPSANAPSASGLNAIQKGVTNRGA